MKSKTGTIWSPFDVPMRDKWLKAAMEHLSYAADEMHQAFYQLEDDSPDTNRELVKECGRIVELLFDFGESLHRADRSPDRRPKTKRKQPYLAFLGDLRRELISTTGNGKHSRHSKRHGRKNTDS
jgi:hypothetical protein